MVDLLRGKQVGWMRPLLSQINYADCAGSQHPSTTQSLFMNSYVLALDLEGTLISNAMSQIPRPGLAEFLTRCAEFFPRIVMFTTVKEDRFRKIARLLVEEEVAPTWFADTEYIAWHGETKDLRFVPGVLPQQVLLVDDFEKYVHPGQEAQWLQIEHFDYPYSSADTGLAKMLQLLVARVR